MFIAMIIHRDTTCHDDTRDKMTRMMCQDDKYGVQR